MSEVFNQTLLDLEDKIQQGYIGELYFDSITAEDFNSLYSRLSPTTSRPRYLYDHQNHILQVRMPASCHNDIVDQLKEMINTKLRAVGIDRTLTWSNLAPLYTFGDISAEPDGCWGPASDNNPTVVMEVGNLETSGQLLLDARHWLENLHSSVQLSILVTLKKNPDIIQISIWELDHSRNLQPLPTRRRLARRTQFAEITRSDPNHRVTLTSITSPTELRIPFAMFTGPSPAELGTPAAMSNGSRPPPGANMAGDMIISQQDLLNLARFHFVARNGYV